MPSLTTVAAATQLPVVKPAQALPATSVRAAYLVSGVADAGLLPRVLEPVAKLGLVPDRVIAVRHATDAGSMTVDLRLSMVSARHAELVEFALRAIVGVSHVVAEIKRPN